MPPLTLGAVRDFLSTGRQRDRSELDLVVLDITASRVELVAVDAEGDRASAEKIGETGG